MKKKGVEIDFGLGDIFKGIGNLIDSFEKVMEEGKEEITQTGEIKGFPGKAKGVYGFSVKMGIGGTPVVEKFGNIKETEMGVEVEETRDPLTDVIEEENKVSVIIEIPGVDEDKIKTEIKGDILNIEAHNKDRKYAKEILLPCVVNEKDIKYSYNNGILEITLSKKK